MKPRTLAIWLSVTGVVAAWAFATPTSAGGGQSAQAAAERYVHAARDRRYDQLADMLSRKSLAHFQLLIDAALYLDEEHFRSRDFCLGYWDRLAVLWLRSVFDKGELQRMTSQEAFEAIFGSDWFMNGRRNRIENSRLPERPSGNSVLAVMLDGDIAYLIGKDGQMYRIFRERSKHARLFGVKFPKEDKKWALDFGVHIFFLNFSYGYIYPGPDGERSSFSDVVTKIYAPEKMLPAAIDNLKWKPLARAKPEQSHRCPGWLEEFDPQKHGA